MSYPTYLDEWLDKPIENIDYDKGLDISNKNRVISESSRNQAFKTVLEDLCDRQRIIYELILEHPDGISTWDIERITGKKSHTWSGRITEMANPKGYTDRKSYFFPPIIVAVGKEKHVSNGKNMGYTIYKAVYKE